MAAHGIELQPDFAPTQGDPEVYRAWRDGIIPRHGIRRAVDAWRGACGAAANTYRLDGARDAVADSIAEALGVLQSIMRDRYRREQDRIIAESCARRAAAWN